MTFKKLYVLLYILPYLYFFFQWLLFLLYQVMSEKNLQDENTEPAPMLISLVLQNCRGHVDHWAESYIRIKIERIHQAESHNLKCLLISHRIKIVFAFYVFIFCICVSSRISCSSWHSLWENCTCQREKRNVSAWFVFF